MIDCAISRDKRRKSGMNALIVCVIYNPPIPVRRIEAKYEESNLPESWI